MELPLRRIPSTFNNRRPISSLSRSGRLFPVVVDHDPVIIVSAGARRFDSRLGKRDYYNLYKNTPGRESLPTMNRAICLALALAAMFAVPEASAEPNKWQYELQERCMIRAMLNNENDYRAILNNYRENYGEMAERAILNNENRDSVMLNNENGCSTMLNNYSAMLNNYSAIQKNYNAIQKLYGEMLKCNHRAMLNNNHRVMLNNENLNKCFYLQIAPGY
jgi:hypothetical protein